MMEKEKSDTTEQAKPDEPIADSILHAKSYDEIRHIVHDALSKEKRISHFTAIELARRRIEQLTSLFQEYGTEQGAEAQGNEERQGEGSRDEKDAVG